MTALYYYNILFVFPVGLKCQSEWMLYRPPLPKIRLRVFQTSSQLNAKIVVPNEELHVSDETSAEVRMSDARFSRSEETEENV